MFSYRHGFHAGNHADVLKHVTLLSCLRLLHKKDAPLMLIDTHAGAGIYDLLDRFATTSQEAQEGILKLTKLLPNLDQLPEDLKTYLTLITRLQNSDNVINLYPGSPYLLWQSMRSQDKLRLMELHPSDFPMLKDNMKTLELRRQDIQIKMSDGFTTLKAFLPPPSRRGLVLIDPSYEDKGDYFATLTALREAIKRFSTGIYLVWYPVLNRLDAKEFPLRLQKMCEELNLPWLQTELRIKDILEPSLSASGMWVINPPWQLKESLEEILPILKTSLDVDGQADFSLDSHDN
jgi:23S rRNA (adenine2030-N6)-methyltransferase